MKSPRVSRISLFKSCSLIGVPDAGHHVAHERPNELAQVVRSFLGGE